jgi:hypothetical protein
MRRLALQHLLDQIVGHVAVAASEGPQKPCGIGSVL